MQAFFERRKRFTAALGQGVAIVPGASLVTRNSDNEFKFRQSSDLHYLTGFDEPDAVLVLAPQHAQERSVLFVLPRDRSKEIWNGQRHGVEGALERFGVDAAYDIAELDARLPDYLTGSRTLHYGLGTDERFDRRVFAALETARQRVRKGGHAPTQVIDPGDLLHEMRLIKSPDEIATMRRAAEITALGHTAAMRATRPGIGEYEIEALIAYTYRKNGAQDLAYPSIVAGGDNATTLHYNANSERLRDGDLLLVDSGCELDTYACDVTRTWPVNGRFSSEQRAIYDIVLAAQKAGIAKIAPGNRYIDFHDAAVKTIVEGLIEVGLLKGSAQENIESERYRDFYMHNTGHWIGLDVHDVGRYRESDGKTSRTLQAGMVMTVEPGIYVRRDLDCDERFKGIGVRIEDDVVCTRTGSDVLTAAIPKEVSELEAIVGADVAAGVG